MTSHEEDEPSLGQPSRGLEQFANRDILEETIGIRPGDHVCALYEYSPVEHMPAVIAYLRDGMLLNERCIYIADETPQSLVVQWLKAEGLDVPAEIERGALHIWSREQWRQPGPLDSIRKAAQVRALLDEAIEQGFKGIRFAVEMTWILDPDLSAASIEEWEALSTKMLGSGDPISAVCLYGRRRLTAEVISAGVRTHPLLLDEKGLHLAADAG